MSSNSTQFKRIPTIKSFVLFLIHSFLLQTAICNQFTKWMRWNETNVTFGMPTISKKDVTMTKCLLLCIGLSYCESVHVNEDISTCEFSTYYPPDRTLFATPRTGWTVYYKDLSEIRSCKDVFDNGDTATGFKTILPDGVNPVRALCAMDKDGGGWTVIQKRESASKFDRGWQEYKDGFGDDINFWIGLENIHRLSWQGNYELRVEMKRANNGSAVAKYQTFAVESEAALYRLTIGNYSYDPIYSDPGDSLTYYNSMNFSTYDKDNDLDATNCAQRFQSGDWYKNCHRANLNGVYGSTDRGVGMNWYSWTGQYESLIYTRMMIRPK